MTELVNIPLHPRVQDLVFPLEGDFFKIFGYCDRVDISNGMCAKVVKATNEHPDVSTKAVKTFSKLKSRGGRMNKRCFEKEVTYMSTIKHSSIMKMLVAYECPNEYVIVMSYYSGGTLKDLLPSITDKQTDRSFLQLLSAVSYLHYNSVAHRDLKPENVLITAEGDAVLCDFGLAITVTSGPIRMTSKAGTMRYLPPEVASRDLNELIDWKKADVYCLGMVLWCMMARKIPHASGLTMKELIECLPEQLNCRESYRRVLHHLLCGDPDERWTIEHLVLVVHCLWPLMGQDIGHYLDNATVRLFESGGSGSDGDLLTLFATLTMCPHFKAQPVTTTCTVCSSIPGPQQPEGQEIEDYTTHSHNTHGQENEETTAAKEKPDDTKLDEFTSTKQKCDIEEAQELIAAKQTPHEEETDEFSSAKQRSSAEENDRSTTA